MSINRAQSSLEEVAFIGSALPRQCGIATFIASLAEGLTSRFQRVSAVSVAVTDVDDGYAYSDNVKFEIQQDRRQCYRQAAQFLNLSGVEVVSLQHEFGLFGGSAGGFVIDLLRELHMPVITTVHTVLQQPTHDQQMVMAEVIRYSDRLVAISDKAAQILQDVYGAPRDTIDLIPHGIPDMPFLDSSFHKDKFGVAGAQVMLTFGLLGPNKGIEHAIRALPSILEGHPDVVYVVLGATHPVLLRREGDAYRKGLQQLASDLGVDKHIMFVNKFVSSEELKEYLGAADIYLTPYLSQAQVSSGTLAYAVGAGKAVVSTPYWHAEELLADGRGMLAPIGDAQALAHIVNSLLDHPVDRDAMRKRAYLFARHMIWTRVAGMYVRSFLRARRDRGRKPRALAIRRRPESRTGLLPEMRFDHLLAMTDDAGLLQHAVFDVPNHEHGYCLDDNARALLLMTRLREQPPRPKSIIRARCCYMAFVNDAFNAERGRFRNFRKFGSMEWLEEAGSEDSHGRALWALGAVARHWPGHSSADWAAQLFQDACPATRHFVSPRACAFTLLGLNHYLERFAGDRAAADLRRSLANRLIDLHNQTAETSWPWFEEVLAYDNARLPQALMVTGHALQDADMMQIGTRSLQWLARIQCGEQGHFVPIGNHGFYRRHGRRARFDQQPIEAQAMVDACVDAWSCTGKPEWLNEARRAFQWLMGDNDLRLSLVNVDTGGCHDGLQPDHVNRNMGAESTLAYLLSLAQMRALDTAPLPEAKVVLPRTGPMEIHHRERSANVG